MNADVFVAPSSKVAARMLADELMIMSAKDSALYTLNDSAAAIWNAADGKTTLAAIVRDHVCAAFDVDAADAMRDAEALVAELEGYGLLRVSAQPISDER